jgi:hypothetical protein
MCQRRIEPKVLRASLSNCVKSYTYIGGQIGIKNGQLSVPRFFAKNLLKGCLALRYHKPVESIIAACQAPSRAIVDLLIP